MQSHNEKTFSQLLNILVLSLQQDELKDGLDMLVSLALQHASEVEDLDQLELMGYSEYEQLCVKAAIAWVKRVTGRDEWNRNRDKPQPSE
jgi:hypothetical protein